MTVIVAGYFQGVRSVVCIGTMNVSPLVADCIVLPQNPTLVSLAQALTLMEYLRFTGSPL